MDTATSNTIIKYFQYLYNETDQQMAALKPICKRGCPWCCYQSVEILNWEVPFISQFIDKNISGKVNAEIRRNLEFWFDFFCKNDSKLLRYMKQGICPIC
jgi:hypothetical protein